jgi:hypothetical protein
MIGISRQDEDGRVEAEFEDPRVVETLLARAAKTTHCLQYIDPYGDTVFNQRQLPVLVEELRAASVAGDSALRDRVEALVAFIEPALGTPTSAAGLRQRRRVASRARPAEASLSQQQRSLCSLAEVVARLRDRAGIHVHARDFLNQPQGP